MVFTALTIAALAQHSPSMSHTFPLVGTSSGFQALAVAAGGWIALKTLVGWRRIPDPPPVVALLSAISLGGSLASISLAILAGVLTLFIEFG